MAAQTEEYQGRRTLIDYDGDARPEDRRVAVFQQYVRLTEDIEEGEHEAQALDQRLMKLREQREELRHHLLDYLGAGVSTKGLPF